MSFAKRNKYGVPISQQRDERQALQQPKFVNRFRARFENFGNIPMNDENIIDPQNNRSNDVVMGSVESFTRPTINFEKQPTNGFISNANYASRPTFEDFNLVLRDEITNTVIGRVYNQLKMQTYKYQPVTSPDGENMVKSKFLGISTKFDVHVDVMDGRTNHTALETWSFYGCQITSLASNEQSYEDSQSIIKITLSCSFDYLDVTQPSRIQFSSNPGYEENKDFGQNTKQNNNDEGNEQQSTIGSIAETTSNFIGGNF